MLSALKTLKPLNNFKNCSMVPISSKPKLMSMNMNVNNFSSINKQQMEQFDKIKSWWHPSSQMHVLFQYNYQRIQFLKQVFQHQTQINQQKKQKLINPQFQFKIKPFQNKKMLDVGCGAGFLTESLTRLGAQVVGLDPNTTSYKQADAHKSQKQSLKNLHYQNCSIEQYLQKNQQKKESFDLVTSMDVVQHVENPQMFISQLGKAVKSHSYLMISTISRTIQTFLTHILLAQYVARIVPIGTHHHQKFINPEQLQQMFKKAGFKVIRKKQLVYSLNGQFKQKKNGGNYILIGKKIN